MRRSQRGRRLPSKYPYGEPMSRRPFEPVYTSAVAVGRALFGSWRLTPVVHGAEHIPDAGGAVLAMTHFGYLEFALVEWATWLHNKRRIRFMAKKEAFDTPMVGALLRSMKHISVNRKAGAAAYADAIVALERGELIGVFPEAGVNASFTVRELKTGAARLAAQAGVPIIPVAVWGGQRLMTKGHKVRLRDRFGVQVSFRFGAPITVTAQDDVAATTDALRATLQGMVDQLQREYPVNGEGQWWQPVNLGGTAPTPEQAAITEAERVRQRESRR